MSQGMAGPQGVQQHAKRDSWVPADTTQVMLACVMCIALTRYAGIMIYQHVAVFCAVSCLGVAGGRLNQDDFPALPTMSRNQRRKQRERERSTASTLAGRLAAAGAPIRVVNRAAPGSPLPSAASAAGPSIISSSGLVRHSSSTGNLVSAVSTAEQSAGSDESGAENSDIPATAQDDFPALGNAAPATQAHPAWVPVRRSKLQRAGQTAAAAASRGSSSAAAPNISDFPSLAATMPSQQAAAKPPTAAKRAASSSVRAPSPKQSVAAAVAAAGGVSEELKAANKALIERCKVALSDEGFVEFRQQSGAFMQGAMSAGEEARGVALALSNIYRAKVAFMGPATCNGCPETH